VSAGRPVGVLLCDNGRVWPRRRKCGTREVKGDADVVQEKVDWVRRTSSLPCVIAVRRQAGCRERACPPVRRDLVLPGARA